ncbi:hypothetical protein L596_021071 [Steinernema carpocapsae]|uniref:AMP-dependent synthetase/ligase domain-containing protein n=1 Tax=Steinernema carpocapsae TaxID=34508 RepID=A0A4U5MW58_STECR|nr:hypothetical protein L596_021071 [Steinernema carpocapsae]
MILKSEFPNVEVGNRPYGEIMLEALWKHSVDMPEKIALVSGENREHRVTYKEVYVQCLSVASFLHSKHFTHGDVACIVAPNCLEFFPIVCGITLNGGAMSGASYAFTEYELTRQFQDCEAKMVFAHTCNLETVLNAAKKCPKITTVVAIPAENKPMPNLPFGVIPYSSVVSFKPDLHRSRVDIDVNRDIALLPYSSGTTGAPKGVMLSHRNLVTQLNQVKSHFETHLIPKIDPNNNLLEESDLLFLPFYHIYGFSTVTNILFRGATGVILSKFDHDTFCRSIQDFKIKFLKVVPPIVLFLAKHPTARKYDLSSVKVLMTAAAPAGKEICEEVMKVIPSIEYVVQSYGMTEVSSGSHLAYIGKDAKFGNCGKLISNLEQKIRDPKTGKDLGIGERGEVCIRGPTIMMGYLNRPQATAEMIDDQGWLRTGDIGYVDKDGYLFIVDRLKELIKVKGLQVPPAELEDLLFTHSKIEDAAVIGVPDEKDGEHPMAFVVRSEESLTEKEVLDYVKERVSHYKQLKGGVVFIREIPKAPSGKILRRFLRDEAEAIRKAGAKISKL